MFFIIMWIVVRIRVKKDQGKHYFFIWGHFVYISDKKFFYLDFCDCKRVSDWVIVDLNCVSL